MKPINHCRMTDELKKYVDGLLLGDGHLMKKNENSRGCIYRQYSSMKHKDWVFKMYRDFNIFGVNTSITKRIMKERRLREETLKSTTYLDIMSRSYAELLIFYNRWYSNGKKVVPKDVVLNPVVLQNWFFGDGSYVKMYGIIFLCTDSFSVEDVEWLISGFWNQTNIKATLSYNRFRQPRIRFNRVETEKFLKYIEPCVVSSFKYKWGGTKEEKEVRREKYREYARNRYRELREKL